MLATESLRGLGGKEKLRSCYRIKEVQGPSRDGEKRVGWRANSWTEKQILVFPLRSDQIADL